MNQRFFFTTVLLIIVFILSSLRPLPMNIYRIEGSSEHDTRYQLRRTIEKYDYEESEWTPLNLVPEEFNSSCYSQWDHWAANGLADRLGKPIAWQRIAQWTYECDVEDRIFYETDAYTILLSKNPMAAYPKFTVHDKVFLTDAGNEVSISQNEYTVIIDSKGVVYTQIQYTFRVEDVYVFIEQSIQNRTFDEKVISDWVDTLAEELKTVLE